MKTPFVTTLLAAVAGVILSACEDSTGPEPVLSPLEKWSFSGYSSTYKSGIAVRSRDMDNKLIAGITVWLTDQSIDCSTNSEDLFFRTGGWIGIHYPEVSLGKGKVWLKVGYWPKDGGLNGNIDVQATASLSKADTANDRNVAGSLEYHDKAVDTETPFGQADIKGSFSVPYCPDV